MNRTADNYQYNRNGIERFIVKVKVEVSLTGSRQRERYRGNNSLPLPIPIPSLRDSAFSVVEINY
jgi:hypothetical protein